MVQARKTKNKQHTGPPRCATSKQAKVDTKRSKEGNEETSGKAGVAFKAQSSGHNQCHFSREQEGSGYKVESKEQTTVDPATIFKRILNGRSTPKLGN